MQARFFPWLDRAGRLSPLKLATLVLVCAPGVAVAVGLAGGWLGPKPIIEANHETGEWAVRFLLLSLLVTPLRRVAQWGKLIAVRRMIGVAALAYALVHVALYVVDQRYDLVHVASEILRRFYLTIGFVALLGLLALGATSTDAMIRRLGGKRWNRLHVAVYAVAVLGLIHYLLQSKIDITDAVLASGLFLLLMGWRAVQRFGRGEGLATLAALAVATALATAALEAGWYHVRNAIPLADVLGANLGLDNGLRPAWTVLIAGLLLLAVRASRRFWVRDPARTGRLRPAE